MYIQVVVQGEIEMNLYLISRHGILCAVIDHNERTCMWNARIVKSAHLYIVQCSVHFLYCTKGSP